jgi:rhomboid protease GluP
MDYSDILFWMVCLSCATTLFATIRRRQAGVLGWMILYGVILLMCVSGRLTARNWLIYSASGAWLLFAIAPGVLAQRHLICFYQQRYLAAARLARIVSWLHPADGWRKTPHIARALHLAQLNETAAATEILNRYRDEPSAIGLAAEVSLYRITDRWAELLEWFGNNTERIQDHPTILATVLRAHGETGNVIGLITLFDRNRNVIANLTPPLYRDLCFLSLFAFSGRRQSVESLLSGGLSMLPAATQKFWLATADLAAGRSAEARAAFEKLLPQTETIQQRVIQRRLAQTEIPPVMLSASASSVLDQAESARAHLERFGARRVLSKHARAIQTIIVLNVMMFVAEMFLGGSTNNETLHRLGAMFPPDVRAGEWWRLVAATFLHFGPLHVLMNMLALASLGPLVEFAFGFRRFLLIYFATGVGSMAAVLAHSTLTHADHITVGASGSVMGIVGATGALMLRGWWRDNSALARRRLFFVVTIILTQTLFDALIPQISMTAHLSGALIGFLITLTLKDRQTHAPQEKP